MLTGVAGILGGTALVRFVSQQALKQAFAVFLVAMGAFVLVKNRDTFRSRPPRHALAPPADRSLG